MSAELVTANVEPTAPGERTEGANRAMPYLLNRLEETLMDMTFVAEVEREFGIDAGGFFTLSAEVNVALLPEEFDEEVGRREFPADIAEMDTIRMAKFVEGLPLYQQHDRRASVRQPCVAHAVG